MEDKVKIKEHLKSRDAFLHSFGDLLPSGFGVYEIAENIRPLYLSIGMYHLCDGFDEKFYNQAKQSAEFLLVEKDYMKLRSELKKSYDENRTLDCTLRYRKNPKESGWIWVRGKAIDKGKRRNLFVAMILDVTKKKDLENELLIQKERYRILEQISDEILFEIDIAKDVMTYSYKELEGSLIRQRVPHYVRTLKDNPVVHPDYVEVYQRNMMLAMKRKMEGQMEYLTKIYGHGYEWNRMYYSSIEDDCGNVTRVIGRIKNIHDEILNRQKNAHGVHSDMKGRFGIQRRVQECLENSELEAQHSLAIVSIDHFRKIIEQNGVAWGDTATQKTVLIVEQVVREHAVVGRLEDGKILIYIKNIQDDELDRMMEEIISSVEHIDNKVANLPLSCSIGAAMMQGAADYITFYREVEESLHIAKITKGENYIRV